MPEESNGKKKSKRKKFLFKKSILLFFYFIFESTARKQPTIKIESNTQNTKTEREREKKKKAPSNSFLCFNPIFGKSIAPKSQDERMSNENTQKKQTIARFTQQHWRNRRIRKKSKPNHRTFNDRRKRSNTCRIAGDLYPDHPKYTPIK